MVKKILVCLMGVAILFTGCASGTDNNSTVSESENVAEGNDEDATADNQEDVTLRFMDVTPRPERQAFYEGVFADFEAETGIKVQYESVPWDEVTNKLTILGAADDLPDVYSVHSSYLGQHVESGWVLPLTDYIEEAGFKESFATSVNDIFWDDEMNNYGDLYTVPDGLTTVGVFVRKDWFEEAGIPLNYDWTWDDFFEIAYEIADPENQRYALSYRGARGNFDQVKMYTNSLFEGRIYDDEGNVVINSEEGLEAFTRYTDMYVDGIVPEESINWGFVEMVDNFTGGLTAMLINDTEVAATCSEVMEDGEWAVLPIPASNKDGNIYAGGVGVAYPYGISTDSENPDAAWQLIETLSSVENSLEYAKVQGALPTRVEVANDPYFSEDSVYGGFIKQLNDPNMKRVQEYGPFDISDLHSTTLHEEVQKYLLETQDAQTALNNICTPLEERMKDYMAENPDYKVLNPLAE